MSETLGQYQVVNYTTPVPGGPLDATIVLGNDNSTRTAHNSHDNEPGVHLQSSTLASRPGAGTLGRKWLTSDGLRIYYDTGGAWSEIAYLSLATGGTVAGLVNASVARSSGANADAYQLTDPVVGSQTVGFGTRIVGRSNGGNAISALAFEAGGSGTNNETQISFYTQISSGAGLVRQLKIGMDGVVAFTTAISVSGPNPALIGQIRLPNSNVISWRNAANSADLTLRLNGADQFAFDGPLLATLATAVQPSITSLGILTAFSSIGTFLHSGSQLARFEGNGGISGGTGLGVEVYKAGIQAFNRTTAAFGPLQFDASALNISPESIFGFGQSPTSVIQQKFGTSSVVCSVGTAFSSGLMSLASNAIQTNGTASASDSWTQSNTGLASGLLQVTNDGIRVFTRGTGAVPGTFAAFWGTATFSLTGPGNLAIGGSFSAGSPIITTGAGVLGFGGRSVFQSPADGTILLTNNAGSSFNYLQFGGTTNAFPLLKRNAATLQCRLADDSADANFSAAAGTFSGTITGALTGNVTGNVSGSSGSTTGNAATATALATARAINGVNFDGTAPITVPAAAGTLTGATLAAGVTASSLTSVGTLVSLVMGGGISGVTTLAMSGALSGATTVSASSSFDAGVAHHRAGASTSVSTSATTIFTASGGFQNTFIIVSGDTGGGAADFIDLVAFTSQVPPVVISSTNTGGGPAARTYSRTANALQLTMASGTYTIKTAPIEMV